MLSGSNLSFHSHRIALLTKTGDRRWKAMPIIRVTKKQIEAANKAREAPLKKDDGGHEEQRERATRLSLTTTRARKA